MVGGCIVGVAHDQLPHKEPEPQTRAAHVYVSSVCETAQSFKNQVSAPTLHVCCPANLRSRGGMVPLSITAGNAGQADSSPMYREARFIAVDRLNNEDKTGVHVHELSRPLRVTFLKILLVSC